MPYTKCLKVIYQDKDCLLQALFNFTYCNFLHFNPNRSLEPKHILFYYRQIVCIWGAGVAGYIKLQRHRQDADKKIKDVREQYHSNNVNIVV